MAELGTLQSGRSFILGIPKHVPALWGSGNRVVWAKGEPLMIAGPQGTGKSTVAQRLVLALLGVERQVLDMPVAETRGRVLYLAADRPAQIARSWRRMVDEASPALDRLLVHRGPLPVSVEHDPGSLHDWVESIGGGISVVVIDSLKDVCLGLTSDDSGAAFNSAIQRLVASDIDVLTLHHNRKANSDNRAPRSLADVYGSVWLTAGHGSVVGLWGDAGDELVSFSHLKQPALPVGPFDIRHDHATGQMERLAPRKREPAKPSSEFDDVPL